MFLSVFSLSFPADDLSPLDFVSEAAPLLLFGFTVAAGADAGISAELLLVLNQFEAFAETMYINNPITVSYTHLDVYKRQHLNFISSDV